jgi:hypothetical protein
MISNIGSQGYAQAANRVQRAEPRAAEARQSPTPAQQTSTQAAAVVSIGGEARAKATETDNAAELRASGESQPRADISIEPVVAQPVPDFRASGPGDTQSATPQTPVSAYKDQASTSSYQGVA